MIKMCPKYLGDIFRHVSITIMGFGSIITHFCSHLGQLQYNICVTNTTGRTPIKKKRPGCVTTVIIKQYSYHIFTSIILLYIRGYMYLHIDLITCIE